MPARKPIRPARKPSRDDALIITTGPSPRGWHRLQQAAECLQKYAWQYEAPISEVVESKSPALAKGSLLHLALAQHYARIRATQQGEDPENWVESREAVALIAKKNKWEEYVGVVLKSYDAYVRSYYADASKWKIVGVEELLSTKIANKYLLTGRADLVVEDLLGRTLVIDHKSSSRLTSRHKEFYSIHGQLYGYLHMARKRYGVDKVAGFFVNMVQLGEPKFARIELERSPHIESHFEQIVVDIEESIERMKASGRKYDEWPKAINELSCFSRYGACNFIDRCRFGPGACKAGNWTWSME